MAAIPGVSPRTDPNLAEALGTRKAARRRLCELHFTDRPWIFAEQVTAADLNNFILKSYDRALLLRARNISALVVEPEMVHHFLLAGWFGRVFEISPSEHCSPVISNIWVGVSPGDASAGFDSPLGSLLATFFTAQSDDRKVRLTGASDLALWDGFISHLIQASIANTPALSELSPGAIAVFEEFVNELNAASAGLSQLQKKLVALWPEQLLKIALLTELTSHEVDAVSVQKTNMEQAATVLRLLGREQLQHHPLLHPAAAKLDPEIAGLLAKLELHGPMSPRELCRRYHKRRIGDLELLLARASELGVLTIINNNVILNNAMPVSVSARQQPMSEFSQTHEIAK